MKGIALQQLFCPFRFFKTDQYVTVRQQNRAFDQHSVSSQQLQLFFFVQLRQLILQAQCFILQAAGIKKLFQRQTAVFLPGAQLASSRIICFNIAFCVFDFMIL